MEVEDAKRRSNFIDYIAKNSYNLRQDGVSFRYILMKSIALIRRKEDFCGGTVNIKEVDVINRMLPEILIAAAVLLSPALIVWVYHKKCKIPISIGCVLSLVLFRVEGMGLHCLLAWLICLLAAITMRRKY